jgi:hypothetical protein
MPKRQPNEDRDEDGAEGKLVAREEGGEGSWIVPLMNLSLKKLKAPLSCHHLVRNQLTNLPMMAHKVKERLYHPGHGHDQSESYEQHGAQSKQLRMITR